jgi:hypothetical protein
MSRPSHCHLLAPGKVSTRDVHKLDEFTNSYASKARAKDGDHFSFWVIGNPVPCHEPNLDLAWLFAFLAGIAAVPYV